MNTSYSIKKYQEVIYRLKLLSLAVEKMKNAQRFLFYHSYPKFSLYCEIFMVLFVYFFQPELLLSYGLILLIIVLIINSPQWKDRMDSKIDNFFFRPEQMNKYIKITDIKSQNFVDEEITKVKLLEEKKDIDEKSSLYSIKKRGIFSKYNNFKVKSAKTLDKLEYLVDLFEKLKNLLTWTDNLMTQYFFILLLILYVFVTFLPVRYITIIYIIRRFYKGKSYYKRLKKSNHKVVSIELEKFMIHYNFKIGLDEEWPKKLKTNEAKLISHFQNNLKIYLPNRVTEVYKTPRQFIEYVSDADLVLRLIENDENDQYIETDTENVMIRVRKPAYKYLLNFLMNYVPSDFYKDSLQE